MLLIFWPRKGSPLLRGFFMWSAILLVSIFQSRNYVASLFAVDSFGLRLKNSLENQLYIAKETPMV